MATTKKAVKKNKKIKETNIVATSISEQPQLVDPIPQQTIVEIPTIKRKGLLFIIALFLGWLSDFLFWEQKIGINFPIFLTTCVIGGVYWLISAGIKPAKQSLFLLIPFLFFGFVTFTRREPLTSFLSYTFTLVSLGLFTTSYQGGKWIFYGLPQYVGKLLTLIFDVFIQPVQFIQRLRKEESSQSMLGKNSAFWGLLRGLVIALPIVFCFGSILTSADVVFDQKVDNFFDDISENTKRLIYILFFAYMLMGVFLHSVIKSEDKEIEDFEKSQIKSFVGFIESTVILGSVSLLFLSFVIVQFQYFFGGENNIGVSGFTYSEYARRGFNELVIVSFFSLVLILGLSSITKRDKETQKRIFSAFNIVLVALVLIILVSAYQRIELGIGWHGYSRLRLYPKLFLIWLALLFITVAILELTRKQKFFAFAALMASFGFGATLYFFNVDQSIIQHNVYRAWHGKNLNIAHLASLSDDAVPLLVNEFLYNEEIPEDTKNGLASIIACYRYLETGYIGEKQDWRSFNQSRWLASQSIDIVRPYLSGYIVRYESGPIRVRTPQGEVYECELDYSEQE